MTRECRECGCSENAPCVNADGQVCGWVEDDLCSACDSTPNVPCHYEMCVVYRLMATPSA